jgi:hypothetical protein
VPPLAAGLSAVPTLLCREERGIVTNKAGKDAGWAWFYLFTLSLRDSSLSAMNFYTNSHFAKVRELRSD